MFSALTSNADEHTLCDGKPRCYPAVFIEGLIPDKLKTNPKNGQAALSESAPPISR